MGLPAAMSGRNILILRPTASDFHGSGSRLGALSDGQPPPFLGSRRPCRAPAVPDGPGRDHPGGAGLVRRCWSSSRSRPPTLQISPGNETHIHAMRTELASPTGRDRRFLRTSPEFACKKLLAAGERRIFEFARCFRNREGGRAAPSRVHHAGMVPGARPVRAADGRLHGGDGLRGADRRHPAVHLPRPHRRTRSPSPSGSRWPRRSTASPAST